MTEYDFIIQYSKGADMPSDYLSRNVLSSIAVFSEDIPKLQALDSFYSSILAFLDNGSLPSDGKQAAYIKSVAPAVFWNMDNFGEGYNVMVCQQEQSWLFQET